MSSSAPVYWDHPATNVGRIEPANADELVGPGGYYAGAGDFVFCIGGDDNNHQMRRMYVDDISSVYQASVDLTTVDVVYFSWKHRTPAVKILPETILTAGPVTFLSADFAVVGDTLTGIEIPHASDRLFRQADMERVVRISGTGTTNDEDFTITSVPWNTVGFNGVEGRAQSAPSASQVYNGQLAGLYRGSLAITPGAFPTTTVKLLGLRWAARAYVDSVLIVESYGPVGTPKNQNLALHVSKAVGNHTLTFSAELEAYE